MPLSLPERKKADIDAQLGALGDEFVHWKKLSELLGPFEKHHSQIRVLEQQMLELIEKISVPWRKDRDNADNYAAMRAAYLNALAVQSLWDYFRSKLLLRSDPWLGPFVKAADAYAWACYEPCVRRYRPDATDRREPPLVALDAEVSPWALARKKTYAIYGDRSGQTSSIPFQLVRDDLPVPILGLPWHNVSRLPYVAVLAHECGHLVESDFDLAPKADLAIKTAVKDDDRRPGWLSWRKEVFADLFACWSGGPSTLWTLIELMPDRAQVVAAQTRPVDENWGKYPTATLRILLNLEALEFLGFKDEAAEIKKDWLQAFPTHSMGHFEVDLKAIVKAFYEAVDFPEELKYSKVVNDEEFARVQVQGYDLDVKERFDARALIAAAGFLHRSPPAGVDLKKAWDRIQTHMVKSRPIGQLDAQAERVQEKRSLATEKIAELLFVKEGADELAEEEGFVRPEPTENT